MGQESGSNPAQQGTHDSPLDTQAAPAEADTTRRRFLLTAATATGAVGAGVAAWPLINYFRPSARARVLGGPVEVNTAGIEPGGQVTVSWRGKPVWVLRRTPEMLERLAHKHSLDELRDPDSTVTSQQPTYAQNPTRSLRPELFVAVALCTHLGCVPSFRPKAGSEPLGTNWMGGYFCPCHGSRFDLAGRVTKNVPAPTNLVIPPHRFLTTDQLEIGVDHV